MVFEWEEGERKKERTPSRSLSSEGKGREHARERVGSQSVLVRFESFKGEECILT